MSTSPEDTLAMKQILQRLQGQAVTESRIPASRMMDSPVELAGPGAVSRRDVAAMADVLARLNQAVNSTSATLLEESQRNPEIREALQTTVNAKGVKIGQYQIVTNLDESRMVNKQNFSVVNQMTGETIAHELGLYEAAHALVRLLNRGLFVNDDRIRQLLEAEATYTSQKMDALRFKRKEARALKEGAIDQVDLYQARKQASMDRAMRAKGVVRSILNQA